MEFYYSTAKLAILSIGVSIPNGMEFYDGRVISILQKFKFQFPTGWNSTLFSSPKEFTNLVSIPNGMEFYKYPIGFRIFLGFGFNSQRDGILQHEFCHFSR